MIKLCTWALELFVSLLLLFLLSILTLIFMPQSPLPPQWNPILPFDFKQPIGFLSQYKLAQALKQPGMCQKLLSQSGANFTALAPQRNNTNVDICHIKNHVKLHTIYNSNIQDLNTRCTIALRINLWQRHNVAPAAAKYLQTSIKKFNILAAILAGPIRTKSGTSNIMSQHATANAIDIIGFITADSQHITIKNYWKGTPKQQAFLHAIHDGACQWFNTVLSPDYNALHANHLHFDMGNYRRCQ